MWQHFGFLASDIYATYANDDARGLRTSALRTVWRCVQSVCYASNKHAFAYIKRDAGKRLLAIVVLHPKGGQIQ